MTNSESLKQIEGLLLALPGIRSAKFVRSDSNRNIVALIECKSLPGFDALARCGEGANVVVTLGQSESSQFRTLTPVSGLSCRIEFKDNENERPTLCERFGFFAAAFLYNASLVDDNVLNELESAWNVNFRRDAW